MRRLVALVWIAGCGHTGNAALDAASTDGAAASSDGSSASNDAATPSRCTETGQTLTCSSHAVQVGGRTVTYEVPLGTPPAAGWPAVVYYQGSLIPGSDAFEAAMSDSFGQYQLTSTVKALLDRGYAVIAPDTQGDGTLYWETNVEPFATYWSGCADDVFVHALLSAMSGTSLGLLDANRRYAMGISSGGFMTSRMAVSYGGTFRALAIASGSYATCGDICVVPALPHDHPPTLFLHGAADDVVPVSTMTPYRDALLADGLVAESIIDPSAGHQWLAQAVTAIPDWFDAH